MYMEIASPLPKVKALLGMDTGVTGYKTMAVERAEKEQDSREELCRVLTSWPVPSSQ